MWGLHVRSDANEDDVKLTLNLEAALKRLRIHGPDRVMIGLGRAVPTFRAEQKRIASSIVFIRDDGWTLGAPKEYEEVAYKTWASLWIAFVEPPDFTVKAIAEYVPA